MANHVKVVYERPAELVIDEALAEVVRFMLKNTVLRETDRPAKVVWVKYLKAAYGVSILEGKRIVDAIEEGSFVRCID